MLCRGHPPALVLSVEVTYWHSLQRSPTNPGIVCRGHPSTIVLSVEVTHLQRSPICRRQPSTLTYSHSLEVTHQPWQSVEVTCQPWHSLQRSPTNPGIVCRGHPPTLTQSVEVTHQPWHILQRSPIYPGIVCRSHPPTLAQSVEVTHQPWHSLQRSPTNPGIVSRRSHRETPPQQCEVQPRLGSQNEALPVWLARYGDEKWASCGQAIVCHRLDCSHRARLIFMQQPLMGLGLTDERVRCHAVILDQYRMHPRGIVKRNVPHWPATQPHQHLLQYKLPL